ncbi:hypothetical protein B0H11DRAFT_2276350 [Mycena galericulata]|nr:hypothetical protein B0H11DRAFT_2276350 [Mycena galericulata]
MIGSRNNNLYGTICFEIASCSRRRALCTPAARAADAPQRLTRVFPQLNVGDGVAEGLKQLARSPPVRGKGGDDIDASVPLEFDDMTPW